MSMPCSLQTQSSCLPTQSLVPTLPVCSTGQPIVYPRNDLSYAENFLHMMFAVPTEKYQVGGLHFQLSNAAMIDGKGPCKLLDKKCP